MDVRAQDRNTVARLLGLFELVEAAGLEAGDEGIPLRFGEVAVALGFVSSKQVNRALEVQATERQLARPRLLGQILIDRGEMTPEQCLRVLDVLTEQAYRCRIRALSPGRELDWDQDGKPTPRSIRRQLAS